MSENKHPQPEVGQIWEDMDARGRVQEFTITEVIPAIGKVKAKRGARHVWIRIDRLTDPSLGKRGYRYIGRTK